VLFCTDAVLLLPNAKYGGLRVISDGGVLWLGIDLAGPFTKEGYPVRSFSWDNETTMARCGHPCVGTAAKP